MNGTRYYSIAIQYDGWTHTCSHLPEEQARDWIWRILSRPTVQSSLVRVQSVVVEFYDEDACMYGMPGDVNPLTGKPLFQPWKTR